MQIVPQKKLRIALWGCAIILGAAQAWISRYDLTNDTVSYLDMGDYFFHGHAAAIVNGIWSPLYAIVLGLTLVVFKPGIRTEYPAVHLLLFVVFLFTLACFDLLLRELALFRDSRLAGRKQPEVDGPWLVISYAFFLWASLQLIGVYETNPDMLVAAFLYLACVLFLRIAAGKATAQTFAVLGLVLGMSYLTKAIMLPVSLLILGMVSLLEKGNRRSILLVTIPFLLVSGPYIAALSIQQGHFSLGETGKYNYAVHVDHVARHHWQGGEGAEGVPDHPTHEIASSPPTFEFAGPVPGTYPVWYDPMFWYQGLKPRVHLVEQLSIAVGNLVAEFDTFFYAVYAVFFSSLVLAYCAAHDKVRVLGNLARLWYILLIPSVACVLYALVHYELRYIGGFFCLFGVALFSAILWADEGSNVRLFWGIALLQMALLLVTNFPLIRHIRHPWTTEEGAFQDVAESARAMGLQSGDRIASLDFSNLGTVQWAHLARLQIIAEIYYWPGGPEGSKTGYWDLGQNAQEQLLQRFSEAGARAVVSSDAPVGSEASRWSRIGKTGYYMLWLTPQSATALH
jgi:hypothetical protein